MNDEKIKKKVREHWNKNPMDYDKIKAKCGSKNYYNQIEKQFRKVCYFGQDSKKPIFHKLIPYKKLKDKEVLVIGCGAGSISKEFAKQGASITAIDLTPIAVKNTKKQLTNYKLNGKVLEADAENLPFKDNSFDFVWSWGVIHHTPNTKKAADEIYRVLKKDGQARIMIYHKNSIFYYFLVQFCRGILQGQYLKWSPQKILNKYTDHSDKGGTPLGKAYTKKQSKKLFSKFKKIKFKTYGVKDEIFFIPVIKKILHSLPDFIPSFFLETLGLGWYLFVKVKK